MLSSISNQTERIPSPGYAYASLNQLQQAQDVLARGKLRQGFVGFDVDQVAVFLVILTIVASKLLGLEYDPDNPVMWSNLAVVSWQKIPSIQIFWEYGNGSFQ